MNYIRGAVNAISAPYQYYKDLPPINPSTLTGAIDVIVIQRPADNGASELVCSPFHVRFGKWQVLRPGEKKVNVSVNGHPIPFNMKIGEAGEAFFVFETDEDVPADLITSPILHPTRPNEEKESRVHAEVEFLTDRFGAKTERDAEDEVLKATDDGHVQEETQEPEFLDLNALPSPPAQDDHDGTTSRLTDNATTPSAPSLKKRPSRLSLSKASHALPSPPISPSRPNSATPSSFLTRAVTKTSSPDPDSPEHRVDQALKNFHGDIHVPEVEYRDDIALDVEGYHSHGRGVSEKTARPNDEYNHSPTQPIASTSSSPPLTPQASSSAQSSLPSPSLDLAVPFPVLRAVSEPPPDNEEQTQRPAPLSILPPVQEYSWEWGAFPQPSPMKASFGKGGRIEGGKGKMRLSTLDSEDESAEGDKKTRVTEIIKRKGKTEGGHTRSHSVPPELEGSPSAKRRELSSSGARYDYDPEDGDEEPRSVGSGGDDEGSGGETGAFGAGGRLSSRRSDPTRFIVSIEGKKIEFELSLVSAGIDEDGNERDGERGDNEEKRGRLDRDGASGGLGIKVFDGRDEVEAARLFDAGKIDYARVLEDEKSVSDPRLVIRWAGDHYITRTDGSPLMDALVLWRDATLRAKAAGVPTRPSSPLSEANSEEGLKSDEAASDDRFPHNRSQSEPVEKAPGSDASGKPTSSSWVQWWSRSRTNSRKDVNGTQTGRPALSNYASSPVPSTEHAKVLSGMPRILKEIPPAESAPALPSTPVEKTLEEIVPPVKTVAPAADQTSDPKRKKFAKTLRLTSDQLKSLNLQPGPNTITFSLSTTGVVACTARIFVWDSTDLVVVSDIDGTITKSDGLGHVFAMIGRDWTHLGVAKLYTDITRNGYKIMYLTSRAIGQADATRDYLKGIKQNDYQLPEGPVIMSPDRLMASLHREVIMRKPEVFKMACLRDIQRLFGEASRNPFYAGFGNRITDALSYRSVNVPSARIFTIDSAGEVKMELLELAGYKSSYIHMTDLVDQMFPPIHRQWAPEFTDFNYWKAPVQEFPLPDLSPPSPALSARSDTSNQSTLARIRNFSLVGSRQTSVARSLTMPQPPILSSAADKEKNGDHRSSQLRQMTSFERLGSALAGLTQSSGRRSASPESHSSSSFTYADSDDEYDDDTLDEEEKRQRRRSRRRSMTSMPGSLEDMNYGMDDDGEDDAEEDAEEGQYEHPIEIEEPAEEEFDDDLLAAGEMKHVPFL